MEDGFRVKTEQIVDIIYVVRLMLIELRIDDIYEV
jgi:hypothetical protein